MMTTRAVLLIGAPGAGKSTVLERLGSELADAGVRHARFELESLALSHPPLMSDAVFAHTRALATSYRERGFDLVLATETVESQWWCESVVDALGADTTYVVRLEAAAATLEQRLRAREPAGWSGLERLVRASAPLAVTMAKLDVDLAIDTESAPLDEAVARIRALIGA